jgi:hypothetical protein
MEFNPDGSLKTGSVEKVDETRAKLHIEKLKDKDGVVLGIELLDAKLPYNLIEGQFHNINTNHDIECDAHLAKKSEMHYEITVMGKEYDAWVKILKHELKDYLDDNIEIHE